MMEGGPSHIDTFDPKPDAPVSVKGEFSVIDTAVPGVQFTEILPNMARPAWEPPPADEQAGT